MGYGFLDKEKTEPDQLHEGTVTLIKCPESDSEFICATDEKYDTLEGDSGGPLTLIENGKHILIGITSGTISFDGEEDFSVYTNINRNTMKEILTKVQSNSDFYDCDSE